MNPKLTINFNIIFTAATCDCALVKFIQLYPFSYSTLVMKTPSDVFEMPEAGVDEASKTMYAGARICGDVMVTCQYAYTVTPMMADRSPLVSWMSYTQPNLTINAVNSSQMGVTDIWIS